ncbi:MAG: NUDIX hydrolase [Lachnospiraceae bacterium]|nr:NUDIX hydrolase [Lachnospiraceae bacterium]
MEEKQGLPKERTAGEDRDAALRWVEVSREHIVEDEWIDFRRSAYRFPDGTVFEPFYSYSRRDYVVIVPEDAEGKFICVRQFRQGIGRVTVEFPAGGIERRDGKEYRSGLFSEADAEDALEAAKRELLEETGYSSDRWTHLISMPSNATIADNYAHIFFARNCRKIAGPALDDTEFLETTLLDVKQLKLAIRSGEFAQAVHVMGWLLAKDLMAGNKL